MPERLVRNRTMFIDTTDGRHRVLPFHSEALGIFICPDGGENDQVILHQFEQVTGNKGFYDYS